MYCPKCSIQNENEQKYCRQCGLPLTTVRLALQGKVDEAMAKYAKGGNALSTSAIIMALCLIGALINLVLIPGPWNGYAVLANSIIGLLIALPMIIAGSVRLSRARRLLSSEDQSDSQITAGPNAADMLLPPAAVTDPLVARVPISSSVTEQTTLNLKSTKRQ